MGYALLAEIDKLFKEYEKSKAVNQKDKTENSQQNSNIEK